MNYHTELQNLSHICVWKLHYTLVSHQNPPYISACTCKHRKMPAFGITLWMLCIYRQNGLWSVRCCFRQWVPAGERKY